MKKTSYKVIGVVKFVGYDEYIKHGHLKDIETHPVLEYQKIESETDTPDYTYWKTEMFSLNPEYKVIYDYMVSERYTLEEAQEKYPELFL